MAPGAKPGAVGGVPATAAPEPAPTDHGRAESEREFVRAVELHRRDQLDQALRHYARAAALDPGHAMAWNNMGVVLRRQGRRPAAIACYRRAVALKPADPTHRSNLGNVLRDLGRLEEAVAESGRAVELVPDSAGALHNHGLVLQDLGRHDDAIAAFDRAIALEPTGPNYQWDRALNLLMKGDLAAGFVEYEVRWKLPQHPPARIPAPEWRGEPLTGRSLLLHPEQGFGDTIQFARYAPMVKAKGAGRVILVCQPALVRILSTIEGVDQVLAQGSPLPTYDLHAPLLSLPRLFGTTLATVPAPISYLRAPTGPGFELERPPGTRLAVGLVWAGKPSHRNDHNRSCPLAQFLALMGDPRIAFYSLQKGPRAADIVETGAATILRDLSRHLEDFADTARAIQQLDLVITVDTAVAHLAGALGRPVWVALPAAGDWRWIRGREDSPWYPSMRLFRQERLGAWEEVMSRMSEALSRLATAEPQSPTAHEPAPAAVSQVRPVTRPGTRRAASGTKSTAPETRPVAEPPRSRPEDTIDVPSVFRCADGTPRFVMPIPRVYLGDAGVGYLHRHETQFGGYEYPTRLFFDRHLEPGDLLIDVGAHWGLYALTAASRWPGEVKVLAIEPAPENVTELRHWIARNGLERDVMVVPAGAGAEEGSATFARNSTMGHGVAQPGDKTPFGTFTAPIVTIDSLVERLPELARRRTFLKIDVEGHEPEVMAGARRLVQSGRVEAIVWERGRTYDREPHTGRLLAMMRELAELGYAHHRLPHETLGGPLIPYVPNHELVNVFSLGRSFLRKDSYARPPAPVPAVVERRGQLPIIIAPASDITAPSVLKPGSNTIAWL